MKKTVLFSLVLLTFAIATQVEGKEKKPPRSPTSAPPKMGWRFGNGRCICKGSMRTSPAPGGSRTHSGHPTPGHHPSGPHGPSRHHPSRPHGHHHHPTGPHGSSRHHPPRPHHHPTGPHGPSRHHPHRPHHHPTGPHGPSRHHPHRPHHHPTGPHGPSRRHRGRHNRRPTQKQSKPMWKKCICGKPAEKGFKIKFRMMKEWSSELANPNSGAYGRMTYKLVKKLAKVLKTGMENIYNMRYTKGSIVAEFEVKESAITKDPEEALRNAIHKGQLSDLEIEPASLKVQQSYSGVKLSEWKTDEDECHRCGSVTQTRECTDVTASCDGIPLTRNASCYEACPRRRIISCGGFGGRKMAKVMIIVSFFIVGAIVIVAVLVVTKVKRNRLKYLKTSPSTSSVKQLADDDKLQSKC